MSVCRAVILMMMMFLASPAFPGPLPDCADADARHGDLLRMHINQYRRSNGLKPLVSDRKLVGIAADHSLYLCRKGILNHDNFHGRFRRAMRRVCVENVARNYRSAYAEFMGWRSSPDHNINLLDPDISRVGLARKGDYITFFACTER